MRSSWRCPTNLERAAVKVRVSVAFDAQNCSLQVLSKEDVNDIVADSIQSGWHDSDGT